MKKGVKRDLMFVITLAVAVPVYCVVGLMLAPEIPDKPVRPETIEGSMQSIQDTLEQAEYQQQRSSFLDSWMWNGLWLGCACCIGYSFWRGFVLARHRDAANSEKPEDSYLSGKAVAVIIAVCVVGMGLLIAWSVISGG